MPSTYDAVIVGAGPNGLSAAVELASHGHSVLVLEAASTIGGGTRTQELTLPGFTHDVCSAFHPMGVASPFFNRVGLDIDWVFPDADLAQPLDDGTAAILERSVEATAEGLAPDTHRYKRLMNGLLARGNDILEATQSPALPFPKHPLLLAAFGALTALSAVSDAKLLFRGERARALFSGSAAHTTVPIRSLPGHGLALLFHICAHTSGWGFPRGGSHAITDALAERLRSLGGEIVCDHPVQTLTNVPQSKVVLFDTTPKQLIDIAGDQLSTRYRTRLKRFRYGPGVFKIDYALDGTVPWKAGEMSRAGVVHLGGTYEEVAASERAVNRGEHPERPWVIVGQQSLFDDTRAPAGKHTLWTYCHVPNGSTVDMTGAIEGQLERFAPGFNDLVLAKSVRRPADLERENENYIGGDIAGGFSNLRQFFTRPIPKLDPYATSNPRLFLCSSSTPPGAAVHGMCGYWAARSAMKRL
ncbi:MAG: NAD(P)/FAD-dependent oxidoreductase [Actinomycetota bacterium]